MNVAVTYDQRWEEKMQELREHGKKLVKRAVREIEEDFTEADRKRELKFSQRIV